MRYFLVVEDVGNGVPCATVENDVLDYNFKAKEIHLISEHVNAKGGRALPDRLFIIASSPMLISARAYDTIKDLRLCPGFVWFPVTVTWRKKTCDYQAGDTLERYDIWDYDRSVCQWHDPDGPRDETNCLFMKTNVIDRSRLPEWDYFQAGASDICTQTFKDAWESAGLTGLRFIEHGPEGIEWLSLMS